MPYRAMDARRAFAMTLRGDHLLPLAGHAAAEADIACDRQAKLLPARRVAVDAPTARLRAQRVRHAPAPGRRLEQGFVGDAGEVVIRQPFGRPRHRQGLGHTPPDPRRPQRAHAACDSGRWRRDQLLRHEGAIARPAIEKTLGRQAFVDLQRGLARYAQLPGQVTRRWQSRPGRQPALHDGCAQLLLHLCGKIAAAGNGQLDVHPMATSNLSKMDI